MDTGEKELRQTFESVTNRNVLSVVQHSNETRELLRTLEARMEKLENNFVSLQKLFEIQGASLAALQQQFYLKGTTSYSE